MCSMMEPGDGSHFMCTNEVRAPIRVMGDASIFVIRQKRYHAHTSFKPHPSRTYQYIYAYSVYSVKPNRMRI